MEAVTLTYPVLTPGGRELLPVGTVLTRDVMESLASRGRKNMAPQIPMVAHGSVAADIQRLCGEPPYSVIFSDNTQFDLLFGQMRRIELSAPLLRVVDYFKTREHYTYEHTLTVFCLSMLLAHLLIQDSEQALHEALGAPTHDFGKLSVPLPVLKKTTPLTPKERRYLEHHAMAGYVLLTYYTGNADHFAAVAARDHHERRDGSGYPGGIPLNDRMVEIVAVADIFDALIATRPYRESPFDCRSALEHLTAMAENGKLGWEILQALVSCNRKDRPHYSECHISLEKRGAAPEKNFYGVTVEGV
jgi:HD-GYP domain-containing protein (c-di-GMP phosphodiesterase class II)